MTTYEQLISDLGVGLGIELRPGSDGITDVIIEDRPVLVRPEPGDESVTVFSIVATDAGDKAIRAALSLNLFGRDTMGGNLGLFADSIILSRTERIVELAADAFAEKLVAFARLAGGIAVKIGAGTATSAANGAAEPPLNSGFMRV